MTGTKDRLADIVHVANRDGIAGIRAEAIAIRNGRPVDACITRIIGFCDELDEQLRSALGAYDAQRAESEAPEMPRPMEPAPRDGTMVRLLVDFTEHATEDSSDPSWTIGANNDDNVDEGDGEGWKFAGWCWCHDHFTQGEGKPVGWLPMLTAAPEKDNAG